jgi:protein O-GlcNAc transferase
MMETEQNPGVGAPDAVLRGARHMLASGRPEEAAHELRQLVAAAPQHAPAHKALGAALLELGRPDQAIVHLEQGLRLAPQDAAAASDLATGHWRLGRREEAVTWLRRVTELAPRLAQAHANLGQALLETWHLGEAAAACRRALALDPECSGAGLTEAALHVMRGEAAAAMAAYQRWGPLAGNRAGAIANHLFASLYDDRRSPAALLDLHRRLTGPWTASMPADPTYENKPDPDRVLRVGYVSPDLHGVHPVAQFIEPVLARHDAAKVEVFAYANVALSDATTDRLRKLVPAWRDIDRLDDADFARAVRADRIDILVDLAGHTARSRLRAFGQRMAPVQVCFLGYPHSTGFAAVDYLVADPTLCPPEDNTLCSEAVLRLEHCIFCFKPGADWPAIDEGAAARRDAVVFGSFNNLPKLSPSTVRLWSAVLRAVPTARLQLHAASFADLDTQAQVMRRFAAEGIEQGRLRLIGPMPFKELLASYNQLDIALDPIPYNGGTTTCQALWMGVPVVTLRGGNFCGRMGESILKTVGMGELIARTPDEFVAIARGLAANRVRRLTLRRTLRARLGASPLCDDIRYTRQLEALYRDAWRRWCATC